MGMVFGRQLYPSQTAALAKEQEEALLYREMQLVDRQRHGQHRVQPVRDWSVARELSAVLVTAAEFPMVSREYAIAFVPTGRGDDGQPLVTPVQEHLVELLLMLDAARGAFDDPALRYGRPVPAVSQGKEAVAQAS